MLRKLHTTSYYLLACLLMVSCIKTKTLDERVTFSRSDKIPYGGFYVFENLGHVFPEAEILINTSSPSLSSSPQTENLSIFDFEDEGPSVFLIFSPVVEPNDEEVGSLLKYLEAGNQVFISSLDIGANLLDTLRLKTGRITAVYNFTDSLLVSISDPRTNSPVNFAYPGRGMDNFFSELDSSITTILGYDEFSRPNFVRLNFESGGSIFIHLAPAALTNFFLLHRDNSRYFDFTFSYLTEDATRIYWDDYYRYGPQDNPSEFSKFGVFLKDPILRWALYMALALMIIIYLFESKRKQRIIPMLKPLNNASLDFIKTVGRLYYQRRDNKDISQKMTAHFLEYVRSRYNISTTTLDETFIQRLSHKTGYDRQKIKDILYEARFLENQEWTDDNRLMEYQHKLEHFYQYS